MFHIVTLERRRDDFTKLSKGSRKIDYKLEHM
jgi:hypothetical protein